MTAKGLRHFHAVSTVIWLVLLVPSVLWWRNSVPWLVGLSVWANVAGHFSAWQAARAEEQAES